MNLSEKINQRINHLGGGLCIGLDTEAAKMPEYGLPADATGVLAFNKEIIAATANLATAYKFNLAFYEYLGAQGWEVLQKTLTYIPESILKIADAKRGDIGNTARLYAQTFFETFNFDSLTVNPFMGLDTLAPFLAYPEKLVWVVALTSNPGAADFELLIAGNKPLYQHIIEKVQLISGLATVGFVVGATQTDHLAHIRTLAPDTWLLVPGIGSQAGDLAAVCNKLGKKSIINVGRAIIYAGKEANFAAAAAASAELFLQRMCGYFNGNTKAAG